MSSVEAGRKRQRDDEQEQVVKCPYLNTIDRKRLDFDFEKMCSVIFPSSVQVIFRSHCRPSTFIAVLYAANTFKVCIFVCWMLLQAK